MVVFELKEGFPKNCKECPLFINQFAGYSPFCIGKAKYTTEEIEIEKDGNLAMYYHGCLSNRPKSCPLKEIIEEPSTIELNGELIRCKECKHFHENVWGDEIGLDDWPIIVGHEACDAWGREWTQSYADGYCHMAKRRKDECH